MFKKNVLLLGGEGYVGKIVSAYLIKKNYNIVSFDYLIYNQNYSKNLIKNDKYKFIYGDLREKKEISGALKNIDHVVILAGLVGDPITKKYPKLSHDINYNGIKNFIDICSKYKYINKIIFISTCSNYGLLNNEIKADEQTRLKALSLYSKDKVKIENYILSMKDNSDLTPTILRFSTAFGYSPRMRFDLTLNEFTMEILNKKSLIIYDKNTWRPYCHVKDFARAIYLVLNSNPSKVNFQVFNVGGEKNNITKKMIIDKIKQVNKFSNYSFQEKSNDPRNYIVNFSKIKNCLNFNIRYSIDFGINEITKYYNNNIFKDYLDSKEKYGNYQINKN